MLQTERPVASQDGRRAGRTGNGRLTMSWIGRKKIAFVPVYRPNAVPSDMIPSHWEDDILRRALYDPDPSTGRDRSLRAYIRASSSGIADLDAVVVERHSVDQRDVPAAMLDPVIGARLRSEGFDAAAIVMLGGRGAATNSGFWSRFEMLETWGSRWGRLRHGTRRGGGRASRPSSVPDGPSCTPFQSESVAAISIPRQPERPHRCTRSGG